MKTFYKITFLAILFLSFWACKQEAEQPISELEQRKTIEMVTDYGTMVIELYDETPLHRDNFINLTNNKAFDSLMFHRVINKFMIQSGDPDSRNAKPADTLGEGDAPYLVKAEFNSNLFHKKGVLAAAREGDNNPEKSSSAMQFYIVQGKVFNDSLLDRTEHYLNGNKAKDYFKDHTSKKPLLDSLQKAMDDRNRERYDLLRDSILELAKAEDSFDTYSIPENQREVYKTIGGTPHLDQNYTVFGEVVQGLEIIDSIAKVETNDLDRPVTDVRIISVRLKE